MTQNNFNLISELLEFNSTNDFYFLQIIKRKKENPESKSSTIIKTYYIDSLAYFNLKKEEIIYLCKINNARAYINLNKRGFEEIGEQVLKKIVDYIISKQYKGIRDIYDSACGKFNEDDKNDNYKYNSSNIGMESSDKRWIIDIDTLDNTIIDEVKKAINNCSSNYATIEKLTYNNIISEISTINGIHLVTHPFNIKQLESFLNYNSKISVLKNSFTLLYYSNDI